MKNKIAILSLSALSLTAPAFNTSAGDHEWATVGKVLTGAALVHAVGHTISHLLPPPPLPLLPPLPPLPGHVHVAGPHLRVIASAPTIPCARVGTPPISA